jgi:acetyltransferase-like isoleucine patch superfamily enzyme
MLKPTRRIIQRFIIPQFVKSIYFFLKYKALISAKSIVQLSDKISFGEGTVVKHFAIIQTHEGNISFGKNCAISSFNHISTVDGDVCIGDNVRIGPGVTILGSRRNINKKDELIVEQGYTHSKTIIGDDVLIGSGAIVLDGSIIGKGAVIGAGCIVNNVIPEYAIAVGIPSKVIGERK